MDASSIGVDRRCKRVKTDPLDAGKQLNLLCRYHGGERKIWGVVNVPAVADEERRQLHRGLKDLQRQQTECSNRIKGLLASQGLDAPVDANFGATLAALRDWAGQAVPAGLQRRMLQEFAVWEALHRQVRDAANEQERQLREGKEPFLDLVRRLMGLKAVGVRGAWVLAAELFAWRDVKNGRELGALVGLTPVPYNSGRSERDQGISKAGNAKARSTMIELDWLWSRHQLKSQLSVWFHRRVGGLKGRIRRITIVGLARKLLIALWRYLETGVVPAGAALKKV